MNNRPLPRFIPIFSLFFILFSCSQKPYDQILSQAERLLDERPDSALTLLRSIDIDQLSDAEKADAYLFTAKAEDRQEHTPDTATLTYSIGYFTGRDDQKLARAYFLRAKAFYDLNREEGDAEHALLDYLEAAKHARKTNDNALAASTYSNIGDIYYAKSLYGEALTNFKTSLGYYTFEGNERNMVFMYGKIGSGFNMTEQPDSALAYQTRALEFMQEVNDSSVMDRSIISSLYKNIGFSYGALGDIETKKHYLLEAYRATPHASGQEPNIILVSLSQLYAEQNRIDSAIYYVERISYGENGSLNDKLLEYNAKYKLYKMLKEYPLALENLETLTFYMDKIYTENISASVYEIQQKYDREALENEYNQVLIQRLYLIVIIIAIVLAVALTGWFVVLKMKRKQAELLQAEQAIQAFNTMLDSHNDQNRKLVAFLTDRLDLARKVAQMNIVTSDNTDNFIKQYNKLFGKNLLDELNWENIYPLINDLYNGFATKMMQAHPDLSEKELQLCCCIRAEFRNEEIAVLLDYTQNTVRVKKSRLSSKLGFASYDAFQEHIIAL